MQNDRPTRDGRFANLTIGCAMLPLGLHMEHGILKTVIEKESHAYYGDCIYHYPRPLSFCA